MISVEEARVRVTQGLPVVPAEVVSLSNAHGRVLAANAMPRVTQPPAALSAMDGYAVRADDTLKTPVTLRVIGYVPAGSSHEGTLSSGEAVRIFTGAPLPTGADAVVMQEDTEPSAEGVIIRKVVPRGGYTRPCGMDFATGQVGLGAGRRLTARDIGFAAAMNVPWLAVRRRPRVGLLATGDEIVLPGEPIGPNQIVSANTHALAALIAESGGLPTLLEIALDTRESLSLMLEGIAGLDLLVTTGGVSVGDHDLVRSVLGERGFELDFWRVAMRPGKPLMFGAIRGTPVLGLPGNPASAFLCGLLFLQPMLEALLGWRREPEPDARACLVGDLPQNDERQEYLRARRFPDSAGKLWVEPFALQDSSVVSLLARADCLVVREPHAPATPSGSEVKILPFGGGSWGSVLL